MKALITGAEGFLGHYLVPELEGNGYETVRCTLPPQEGYTTMDILKPDQVREVIAKEKPDVIFHLAGQSNVGISWKQPALTMETNAVGFINVLDAVREVNPQMRVVAIGSSDEYGNLREAGDNVTEEVAVHPMTPYAASKVAQENIGLLYNRAYRMNICMVRSFNHGAAHQIRGFMLTDFASGIAEIEAGKRDVLKVGNLDSARDFTHAKDAVRAYRLIAEKGRAGEIYNVGSGRPYKAQEILDKMIALAKCEIKVEQDPARMRPSDTPVIRCNHDRLTEDTGWMPELTMDDIVSDVLNDWRARIAKGE